jgi:CheY-like chemotaxis protein
MDKLGYILLVDDSENDVELAVRALSQSKLVNQIITLHDGADALDFLYRRGAFASRTTGDPIVVLLDIKMPRVDGFEVLRIMKGDPALKLIPVVMLTSSRQGPDVDECYRIGANGYVVKPVDFGQFSEAIKAIGIFWAVLNEPASAEAKAASSAILAPRRQP